MAAVGEIRTPVASTSLFVIPLPSAVHMWQIGAQRGASLQNFKSFVWSVALVSDILYYTLIVSMPVCSHKGIYVLCCVFV